MIEDGITESKYIETGDNVLCDLKRFQDFLYRHLYKHKDYEAMSPRFNQPCRFFATAKTHKFKSSSMYKWGYQRTFFRYFFKFFIFPVFLLKMNICNFLHYLYNSSIVFIPIILIV